LHYLAQLIDALLLLYVTDVADLLLVDRKTFKYLKSLNIVKIGELYVIFCLKRTQEEKLKGGKKVSAFFFPPRCARFLNYNQIKCK